MPAFLLAFFNHRRWWQDYSIEINKGENPVRGDRATIENPTIKIQWLCHRFQRFMMFCFSFAIILSPALAGFEISCPSCISVLK